jgi:mannose-1-phosphate guanylyltransferase/mannose-6-phosphate isomerase
MAIHPVIMCGGSGTRLWPVSDRACPKQFHRLVSDKSVFQETVLRFRAEGFAAPVIISNGAHRGLIEAQLTEIGAGSGALLLEPEGRNTAAVAAMAALHLAALDEEALGLLVPSDHFIGRPDVFLDAVRAASQTASSGYITTFGIAPTRPDTGFGYIQAGAGISGAVSAVAAFREKPDAATAATYLASGAYSWNAGIFLFRPEILLAEFEAHAPDILASTRAALTGARREGAAIYPQSAAFAAIRATSLDYAVMEKTARAAVHAPLDCAWSDIGTWSMIGEISARQNTPAPVEIGSEGCLVHAAEGILIALVGTENLVVVADGNRVLVAAKDRAQDIGAVVKALKERGLTDFL